MNRTPVTSSQIAEVGYDPELQHLEIQFTPNFTQRKTGAPGSVYQYSNVPPTVHAALMAAESHGSFFIKNIKPHVTQYPYVRIS